MNIHQVGKNSKYPKKPNNKGYHHYKIEDSFNLMIHWDECVDNP